MQRRLEDFIYGGFLDLLAAIHHNNPLRGLRHHAQIMRDQHDCCAHPLLQLQDKIEYLRLNRNIQRCGRLVSQQHMRIAGQGHRGHRTLPHAARKLVRIFARAPCRLGNLHQLEHLYRLVKGLVP